MRQYAPLVAVVCAISLLVTAVYVKFINPPDPFVISLEPSITEQLRHDNVSIKLLHATGEAQALVTRWSSKEPGKLLIYGVHGPRKNVEYSYMVIYWSNGAATLHEINLQLARASQTPDPGFLGV